MIKLIITDLDGTLLDDEKNIHPDFWEVEKLLTQKGVLFGVASGRQHGNLAEKFSSIADRIVIIAENGTYVTWKGDEILCNSLDKNKVHQLVKKGRTLTNAYVIVCGKRSAYVENTDPDFLKEAHTYYQVLEIVPDLLKVEDEILKVTICDFIDAGTNSYPQFKEFETDCAVTVSGKIWLDISHRTASKGAAIEAIQQQFTISPDETMVFGDFLNDLTMMKQAAFSYAMKNSHPDLIKAANFITQSDNNHNGVVETIREVCLLNED